MPARTKTKATAAKPATKAAGAKGKKKLSALDAAAEVLAGAGGSMSTKELIEAMAAKKLWSSPNGKTPAATLSAAILREITTKGPGSRFHKTEPGKFAATTRATGSEAPKSKAAKGATKNPAGKKAESVTVPAETVPAA